MRKAKKQNPKSINELFSYDFSGFQKLNEKQIKTYQNHKLLNKCFPISKEEVINNLGFIVALINEHDTCNSVASNFCPYFGYHLNIKRNPKNNLLSFYYQSCNKIADLKAYNTHKLNNFLYNSYASSVENYDIHQEKTTSKSKNQFLRTYFNEWKNQTKNGIYIYGAPGVGKTFLFKLLANKIISDNISKNYSVALIFMPELVESIKKTFGNNEQKNLTILNAAINADYLFLDDVGSEYATNWFYANYFLIILNKRIESKKPTFFNSNLSIDQYERKISSLIKTTDKDISAKRIIDRIKRIVNKNIFEITDEKYVKQNK